MNNGGVARFFRGERTLLLRILVWSSQCIYFCLTLCILFSSFLIRLFVPRIDLQICLGNPFSKDLVGFSEWIDEAAARGVGFPLRCLPALNESTVMITYYDTGF